MNSNFDRAFNELLAVRRQYEILRAQQAPFFELIESRTQLINARAEMSKVRRSF